MNHHDRALEILEHAERETPFCEACGEPTVPVARGGALWLECVAIGRPRGRLASFFRLDIVGHTRRLILDPEELQAVA